MSDLVAFLRARLDEDEAYALGAFGDHNNAGRRWSEIWSGALQIGEYEDLLITNDAPVSRFMARNDPGRVLAEVEAKRRIIEEHLPMQIHLEAVDKTPRCNQCGDSRGRFRTYPCPTLRLLAQPYADHPDFDPDWRL
jgi:hypothetical protein